MRIVAGELRADSGTVALDGAAGFVHQHFLLVNDFTIAENLALATRTSPREAERIIAATGIALGDVTRRAAALAVGEKAKLELIKAIARKPSLLILDEPTSVLTPFEAEELFAVMRRLAAEGTAVVFITHKIREVLAVATRVVVMRRGRVVEGVAVDANAIAEAMVSHPPESILAARSAARIWRPFSPGTGGGENQVLRTTPPPGSLAHARDDTTGIAAAMPSKASSTATRTPAKILAIVGVAGNGQRELAERYLATHPRARLGFIPEDRTRDGLVAEMSIAENVALTAADWRAAVRRTPHLIDQYSIRAQSPRQAAGALSGGNQQKVLLARELDREPELIVAAEPTRGLDVEATRFVREQLRAAAARGAEVVLITSDLDEAFELAEAIQVIYRGKLSERMTPAEATSRVAALMAGLA
jgi:ABC-type uncharacterized transport system ATPase subunit